MTATKVKRIVRCARCNRKLKDKRWVFSRHTRAHYCWPGTGCNR